MFQLSKSLWINTVIVYTVVTLQPGVVFTVIDPFPTKSRPSWRTSYSSKTYSWWNVQFRDDICRRQRRHSWWRNRHFDNLHTEPSQYIQGHLLAVYEVEEYCSTKRCHQNYEDRSLGTGPVKSRSYRRHPILSNRVDIYRDEVLSGSHQDSCQTISPGLRKRSGWEPSKSDVPSVWMHTCTIVYLVLRIILCAQSPDK